MIRSSYMKQPPNKPHDKTLPTTLLCVQRQCTCLTSTGQDIWLVLVKYFDLYWSKAIDRKALMRATVNVRQCQLSTP